MLSVHIVFFPPAVLCSAAAVAGIGRFYGSVTVRLSTDGLRALKQLGFCTSLKITSTAAFVRWERHVCFPGWGGNWNSDALVTSPVCLTRWSATVRLVHPLWLMLHLSVKSAAGALGQNEKLFTQISLWHILGHWFVHSEERAAAGLWLFLLNTSTAPYFNLYHNQQSLFIASKQTLILPSHPVYCKCVKTWTWCSCGCSS